MSIDPANSQNKNKSNPNIGGDPSTWSPENSLISKDPKTWWPPQREIYGKDPATWSPDQKTDYIVAMTGELKNIEKSLRQEAQNQIIRAADSLFKDVDAKEAKRCIIECFSTIYVTENLNKEMRKLFERLHDLQIGA